MKSDFVFTSESVTEGHPDKLCDLISDAIVDQFLIHDPYSRILAECAVANGVIFISARFVSEASVDIPQVARQVIQRVGYSGEGFNAEDCTILTNFTEMPKELYSTVDERNLSGGQLDKFPATRHATIFGFACNQTETLMPLPIWLAHQLTRAVTEARVEKKLPYLLPDATIQVAVEYKKQKPYRIHSINMVTSHEQLSEAQLKDMRQDLVEQVISPVIDRQDIHFDATASVFVNPEGPLVGGGPVVHSGLTGRKNAVDLYGQYCRRSGAALSGKDPSRIDRIGNYQARYAAKNIVAAKLADECEVQLSYSIGQSQPVSIQVETFGTGKISDDDIVSKIKEAIDFRPAAIIANFNLRQLPADSKGGFYQKLAVYGHVGRNDIELPWEQNNKVKTLKS
ncbi:MAG: S-adenosylmethionine synthetase [Gammaproteobacteria bacterium SG8_11]|nr:MAG: S-adenosylmethionine synthetase [Gammaproteobacteria bacterium SG8_11]